MGQNETPAYAAALQNLADLWESCPAEYNAVLALIGVLASQHVTPAVRRRRQRGADGDNVIEIRPRPDK